MGNPAKFNLNSFASILLNWWIMEYIHLESKVNGIIPNIQSAFPFPLSILYLHQDMSDVVLIPTSLNRLVVHISQSGVVVFISHQAVKIVRAAEQKSASYKYSHNISFFLFFLLKALCSLFSSFLFFSLLFPFLFLSTYTRKAVSYPTLCLQTVSWSCDFSQLLSVIRVSLSCFTHVNHLLWIPNTS